MVVIVILGILAAIALPKYVGLEDEANQAVAQGVAGSFSAVSAMKFAQAKAQGAASYTATCDGADLQGGLPANCSVTTPPAGCSGGTDSCVVNCGGQTATASLVCY